jgi:hypothetical protein
MSNLSTTFLSRQEFKNLYKERIYIIAYNLEKLYKKKTKLTEHINFLEQCKQHNLIPNGLKLKDTTKINRNEKLLKQTMHKIRNNTLQNQRNQLNYINNEIKTQTSILNTYLKISQPLRQHENDLKWINKYDGKFKHDLIETHIKKLNELQEKEERNELRQRTTITKSNPQNNYDTTNVINMSKIQLNQQQMQVLSKGLKFVPTPNSINAINNIVNCEKSLFSVPVIIKNAAISEISTFIQKWKKPKKFNMTKEEMKLLNEIKSIDDIVIVQADKGGKIVIMDKLDYITKIEEKLSDKNVYQQVKTDPTTKIKEEINNKITKLMNQNKITLNTKYYLTSIDDLPKIRGQPKLHKTNAPMRIVTCSKNTITSPISQYVFKYIKELRSTLTGVVNNTFNFVKEINNLNINHDERLASLDIQDLYTNIPVTKAVDITIQRLNESNILQNSLLTKTDIKDILHLSLKNSYFQFNGKYYKQNKGLPMGNTLSPIIADIYMDYYMNEHLQQVNINDKIWRYVDDILIITKMNKHELDDYVDKLNNINGSIRFTSEYEQNDKINFLDTELTRINKNNQMKIKTRWFRKETASDRLLNYESCHGKSIKTNIVKNMATRIIQTTEDAQEQKEDLSKLKTMLLNSNYPPKEIEKLIKQTCENINSNSNINNAKNQNDNKQNTDYSLCLPYVPGLKVLKRKLEKKLKIKLYFSYPNKLQSYFNRSMKTPSNSIIYQIPCECGKTYVGQTKVGINNRMKQHYKSIVDDKNKNLEMIKHHQDMKYQCLFDVDKAFIIEEEKDYWKRRIKESIYSQVNQSINAHDKLNEAWTPIIHMNKQIIERKIKLSQETFNKYKRTKT